MRVSVAFWILVASGGVVAACSSSTPAPVAVPMDSGEPTGGTGGAAAPGSDAGTAAPVDAPISGSGGMPAPTNGSGGGPGMDAAPVVDAPAPPTDTTAPSDGAVHSTRVLIYTRTTGQRHDSIPVAADFIGRSAKLAGLTTETSEDTTKFTDAGLAPYGAIILLATTGQPFGPGTVGIDALAAYVKNGGALVGIENATHAYDDATTGNSDTYVSLLGADFAGHPGDFTSATCTKHGSHPSVAMLPASFNVMDEIYSFTRFRMDNQVVLTCASDNRPVSWYREEGAGRIFYTALGHANEIWMMPPLVDQHVIPGLLWAMRR